MAVLVEKQPHLLDGGQISALQVRAVLICFAINIMDGFDVLAMAFAAPAVGHQWTLEPARIGLLLSAGPLGMGVGALLLSPLGDIWGRRPAILLCVSVVGSGMLLSALARSYEELAFMRFATGVGIGAVLTSSSAMVAEYCPTRWRGMGMALMAAAFPTGAVAGGAAALFLAESYGWRSIFLAGALGTLALVPLALIFLPESVEFLMAKRRPGALDAVNRLLEAMNREPIAAMPRTVSTGGAPRFATLFQRSQRPITLSLAFIFFSFMTSFYFILSWLPKLAAMAGYPGKAATTAGLLLNIGGVAGALAGGVLLARSTSSRVAICTVLLMCLGMAATGIALAMQAALIPFVLVTGVAMFSSMAALYTLMLQLFPVALRVTGVGLVSTAGRIGAVAGPSTAGLMVAAGSHMALLCVVLAVPAAAAALAVALIGAYVKAPPGAQGSGRR
ncbi:Gentisate transporter (plasmid) [Sphingobium sp. EP60837]|nr:Gentisate transporter [Sphingobium sp. EP60837]